MKKSPDFEYNADKDQLEGEDVSMLDGDNAPPEALPDVEDEGAYELTSQSSQWEEYPSIRIIGETAAILPANGLKRRFGSWYFLRVKSEDQYGPAIVDIFKRPLVIWDAVCRALNAAEDHVTMVWVSEAFRRREIERPLHGLKSFSVGYSLFDFINLLNPLEENKNQLFGKWPSCIALYLSIFVLGSHLREEYIHEQDEIISA
ncbi:hypothetical protein EV421DRAFT_1903591 [Armillaria borealis]|uniref:Uncharacterized protein n=1 Tax=Armillaria borealis TaxID=47425 RepID=A0AA39JNB7_9AGAR|nr:hypothetical protein EV421DRAFT_1903591 [Armillaria borealis]